MKSHSRISKGLSKTWDLNEVMEESVKFPINLQDLDYKQIKLLSVYLELKFKAKDGLLTRADMRPVYYYKQRLTDLGIIKLDRTGKYYQLRRYAYIWRLFGIEKTLSKNKKYFKVFCRKLESPKSRKEIQEYLFQQMANTLGKKIKYVRNAGRRPRRNTIMEAPLSARTVAKHLGYKQPCTGAIKRKKYFKLSDEPLEKQVFYNPNSNCYPNGLIVRLSTQKVIL